MAYATAEQADKRELWERMESRYDYPEKAERISVLGFITGTAGELVQEFYDWFGAHHMDGELVREALPKWEMVRFGAPLYESAHGALWFHVRRRLAPTPGPRLTPGLTSPERKGRMLEALEKLVVAHSMPEARLPYAEPAEREPGSDDE